MLDIKPEVKFKNYKGLKFKKTLFEVTDAEVEASIQNTWNRSGRSSFTGRVMRCSWVIIW